MKISRTVFELQSGHDFVTDRRTDRRTNDQGKNNMSTNPKGGNIINQSGITELNFAGLQSRVSELALTY